MGFLSGKTFTRTINTLADRYLVVAGYLAKAVHAISMFMGLVLVTIVVYQVISRYIFRNNPIWIPELARFLSIWLSLLLAGVLLRHDRHLKVLILYNRADIDLKFKIRMAQLLGIFLFSVIFTYYGFVYTFTSGFRSVSIAMGIDMYLVYAIFPISGVLLLIFSVERMIMVARDPSTLEVSSFRPGGDE